jgi:hypothetical protein
MKPESEMNMRHTILIAALLAAGTVQADEPRVLKGESAATELKALRLDARVGQVRVTAHDADTVTWTLELEAKRDGFFSSKRDAREAIAKARIEAETSGTRLILGVRFPAGTDEDDIEEHWTVNVPVRFSADVDMAVGQLNIEGIAGGVDADLAVGEIDIRVPSGRVRADTSVGEIQIENGTKSPGDIELEANVGDVSLDLDGYRVPTERGFGPGAEIDMRRDGEHDIEASVNVGDVRVTIKK